MNKRMKMGLLGLALVLCCPAAAWARGGWGGHYGGGVHFGGYAGGRHYGGHYGGWGYSGHPHGWGAYYGPGVWGFGLGWGWPYFYPYNSYYYGYPSTVIQVPSTPPVYIERNDGGAGQAPQAGYWYYCRSPEGYYPYVKECPNGWEQVSPQPQDR